MKPNLDTLKTEVREYLESNKLAIFIGFVNDLHEQRLVLWDVHREQDYRKFVDCAVLSGARLLVYNYRDFERAMAEDALERLEETDIPRDEQRTIERRLREFRNYDGFTCSIELSFEHQNKIYVYNLRTEWYEEMLDLMEQIEMAVGDGDLGDEDEPIGGGSGYFSRN